MIPEEVYNVRQAEVEALRAYSKTLEEQLERLIAWHIRMHSEKTLDEISPELRRFQKVIMGKSNSGAGHRL